MWRRILRALTALIILLLWSTPALAGTSNPITVTGTPAGGGAGSITFFTVTYVDPHRVDLSWGKDGDSPNVMIRAQSGGDLHEIPDQNTAPSEGYLVYYGAGLSTSDTSMDFDQLVYTDSSTSPYYQNNPTFLYYKIWAQRADGTWHTASKSGWKESELVIAIFFGLLAMGSTLTMFLSKGARSPMLGFPCGVLWFLLGGYMYTSLRVTATDIYGISSFAFFLLGVGMIYFSFAFNNKDLDFTRKQSLESGLFIDEGKRKAKILAAKTAKEEAKAKEDTFGDDPWGDDDDLERSRPSLRAQQLHARAALRKSGVYRRSEFN